MKSCIWAILIVTIVFIAIIRCEPEPMARPTRPKVFTSQDQLRKYLDSVTDHYFVNGKARYGKRTGQIQSPAAYLGYPLDTLKFILGNHHRILHQKEEKGDPIKGEIFRDFRVLRNSPPNNFNDMIDKYYDDEE